MTGAMNPNPSPRRMHDRRYFYKYVTTDVAKIVMATRKLRWSSPLKFNDPFDVTQQLRLPFSADDLNLALAQQLAALFETGDPTLVRQPLARTLLQVAGAMTPQSRAQVAAKLRSNPGVATPGRIDSFNELRIVWHEVVPLLRALCLSESYEIVPMWAHYAENGTGAVLEFEAIDHLDSVFLMARKVVYQDTPPAIATPPAWAQCMLGTSRTSYMDLFSELMYVKTTPWSYEREWRLVTVARPDDADLHGDWGFHPRELAGVYLGPRCSGQHREDILALRAMGLEHIRVCQAAANPKQGTLEFQPLEL